MCEVGAGITIGRIESDIGRVRIRFEFLESNLDVIRSVPVESKDHPIRSRIDPTGIRSDIDSIRPDSK